MSAPTPEPKRDEERSPERRRTVLWIALILAGLALGIAGLWKLSHLMATEPVPPRATQPR